MDNLETIQDQSDCFEIDYNERRYRFVPKSNYWICTASPVWNEQWVICSDDMGIILTKHCESLGYDMEQLMIDNKCPKRRMKVTHKKTVKKSSGSSGFVSLFGSSEDNSDDDDKPKGNDNFISLF